MSAAGGAAAAEPARTAAHEPADDLQRDRSEIERIDRELIALLAERVAIARRAGATKRRAGLPVLDPAREAAIVRRAAALARSLEVDDEDVRYIFWHVIGLCRRAQLTQ